MEINKGETMAEETKIREFDTGATRDVEEGKLDYEGFLSPIVLEQYAYYMHKNRVQKDGSKRTSDNWQKGIPQPVYMKSLWRHFVDLWLVHRGFDPRDKVKDICCAIMFNVMGYLHEELQEEIKETVKEAINIEAAKVEDSDFVGELLAETKPNVEKNSGESVRNWFTDKFGPKKVI